METTPIIKTDHKNFHYALELLLNHISGMQHSLQENDENKESNTDLLVQELNEISSVLYDGIKYSVTDITKSIFTVCDQIIKHANKHNNFEDEQCLLNVANIKPKLN